MAVRSYEFITGPETPTLPTTASPTSGTFDSPNLITAGGGVPAGVVGLYGIIYVQGSGGPVDVVSTPQVAAGTIEGQMLVIIGTDDTNYVLLENGDGLSLNGDWIGRAGSVLTLVWDSLEQLWREISRVRGG